MIKAQRSTTDYIYAPIEQNSPGSAADGRVQRIGWHSTGIAALNMAGQNIHPVKTGDTVL